MDLLAVHNRYLQNYDITAVKSSGSDLFDKLFSYILNNILYIVGSLRPAIKIKPIILLLC